jgi:type IV pilus assembly protein PilA
MKSDFNNHKNGFTIIELMIFIAINSLLATIVLPGFLSQSQKAKQAEAKNFVGKMNRAQQAYYLEHQNVFASASNFRDLAVGKQSQTRNYIYSIVGGGPGTPFVTNQAILKQVNSPLKTYTGGVSATLEPGTNNIVTQSILCEAEKPAMNGGVMRGTVIYSVIGPPICPVNMIVIK